MTLLQGKKGLIVGVANERSMAYGIARAAHQHGASLAFSYQDERFKKRVAPIAEELGAQILVECDVTNGEHLTALAAEVGERWGELDFLVHAVAWADPEDLKGRFVDTSRAGFAAALDVSAYSLVALCRTLEPLLAKNGASVMTLSYYGAHKAVPGYNVMGVAKAALEATVRYLAAELGPPGIRVNALSPGPLKTLSAAAFRNLGTMLELAREQVPLRRNISKDDVGSAALFLLSSLSGAMTGEVLQVDCGYHILGAPGASR